MKQGDIYLIGFPFSNMSAVKVRPAIIISNDKFNRGNEVLMLGIYGREKVHSIPLGNGDIFDGKLAKQSYLSLSNLIGIEKFLLLRKIGSVNKEFLNKTVNSLLELFKTS